MLDSSRRSRSASGIIPTPAAAPSYSPSRRVSQASFTTPAAGPPPPLPRRASQAPQPASASAQAPAAPPPPPPPRRVSQGSFSSGAVAALPPLPPPIRPAPPPSIQPQNAVQESGWNRGVIQVICNDPQLSGFISVYANDNQLFSSDPDVNSALRVEFYYSTQPQDILISVSSFWSR